MRVLYVSKALVVAAYRDKLTALAAHADVHAVIPERWGSQPIEAAGSASAPIETCPVWLHGHNHLHLYRGLGRVLDRVRPDLVHIDEEPYSAVSLQVVRLCARRAIPCLFFAWQNLPKRLPPPFAHIRARVFLGVRGAIAGTHDAAEVLRRAGFTKRLAVIPQFGVDATRFRPDPEARQERRSLLGADGDFVIGYGGRLVREKGPHLLVSALADLPFARLVLLGEGPERDRLVRQALDIGVGERVHFVGRVPSLEMPAWLASLDVLVLPSLPAKTWVEQFGRILVEGMACGVPVVGSQTGEIPRVIGEAGLIVPAGDVRGLVRALRDLAGSPALRVELARRGRARVVERYTQERIARDTVSAYRALLGAGGETARAVAT